MYVEVKEKGKSKYFYLAKSLRVDGKYKKVRVYLGKNISKKDLEKEKNKKKEALEEKINSLQKKDPLFNLLTDKETEEIGKIRRNFKKFKEKKIAFKKFLEWFEVPFTYNTTAIEGSTLSQQEVSLILVDKLTPKGKTLKEIKEIENHKKAFEYIVSYKGRINKKFICRLHEILTEGILPKKYSGAFRDVQVFIKGVETVPPKPAQVEEEFKELMKWYRKNKRKYNPVVVSAYFHAGFESVHPFVDFNGRVGRLLMNFILLKNDLPMVDIKNKRKLEYYRALKKANKGDLRSLVKIIVRGVREIGKKIE